MAETAKKEVLGEVKLKGVILSFAALFEPADDSKDKETGETIKGQYKANGLMKKGTPETAENMAKIKAASTQVKLAKYHDESKFPKYKPEKVCLRDGDLENWEGYEGHWYISSNSADMPVLLDRVRDEKGKWVELTKANGGPKKLYSGAVVNIIVRIWAQDNEYGKRINAEIKAVQFVKHGTPFSGRAPVDPESAFDDDDVGADDLDMENGAGYSDDDDLI
jgi:hypothetical protein